MERVQRWIEANGVLFYKILDQGGSKVVSRSLSTVEESVSQFEEDYDSLTDGKYSIAGAVNAKTTLSRSSKLSFQVGVKNSNSMDAKTIEEIRKKAYDDAMRDFQYIELDKRMTRLEDKFTKLIEIVSDMKDSMDGDSDKDVFEKITENAGKIQSGLELMKDFKL